MKQGTRSLLVGCHQFIWHPLLVIVGWVLWHNSFPRFWELVCIFIHDWGVWGTDYLDGPDNKVRHPERGANIAKRFFGEKGWMLIAGHSLEYIKGWDAVHPDLQPPDLEVSDLFYADKYSWLITPNFLLTWQHRVEGLRIEGNNQVVRQMALTCLYEKKDMHKDFMDRKED